MLPLRPKPAQYYLGFCCFFFFKVCWGAILGLLLTNANELIGDIRTEGCLVCSDRS